MSCRHSVASSSLVEAGSCDLTRLAAPPPVTPSADSYSRRPSAVEGACSMTVAGLARLVALEQSHACRRPRGGSRAHSQCGPRWADSPDLYSSKLTHTRFFPGPLSCCLCAASSSAPCYSGHVARPSAPAAPLSRSMLTADEGCCCVFTWVGALRSSQAARIR